jgi:hypothetical protein
MRKRWLAVRAALDHPRLWRVTAILAALLLCGLLVAAAQGSIDVLATRPADGRPAATWARWCSAGRAREDRTRLAYCARVDGLVVHSTRGPAPGESHVAVIGDFHLTIVRLPDGARTPPLGGRLIVVGPLVRARDGQREVQAFRVLHR